MSDTNKDASLLKIVIAYFMIYVVWGSTYYFIGVALQELPPMLLGALRFTAAGIILLLWSIYRGEPVWDWNLLRRSAISGVVLLFVDMAVVMIAQTYISSSLVAIIASSTAIWIAALDVSRWKKHFGNWQQLTGLIIGFMGVAMLFFEQLLSEENHSNRELGVLLLCFGCVSWALGSLYAKYRSSGAEKVNASAGTAWQMLFAGLVFWIAAGSVGDIHNTNLVQVGMKTWMVMIYLITFGSLAGYSSYIWLLKVRPAVEVSTHAYVNPVIAVIIGTLIGGESISIIQIAGLVIILSSVMLVNRKSWKETTEKESL